MTVIFTIIFIVLPLLAVVAFAGMLALGAITGAFALTAHVIDNS
jgi:hypothetical protein